MIHNTRFSTKLMAQIALMLALAFILHLFKIYRLPQGGAVTLGSMVPILLIGIIHGPRNGALTGLLYGVLNLILDPFFVHPVQILLDYPLPFMLLGIAGFFPERLLTGCALAISARFLCHFLSGAIFFASYAPAGMSPYWYSFLYNGSQMGVEAVICVFILKILPLARFKTVMSTAKV